MNAQLPRGNFNELINLLSVLAPNWLGDTTLRYPEFNTEISRGPDAGSSNKELTYAKRRSEFAIELSRKACDECAVTATAVLNRSANIELWKTAIAIFGGASAAAFLASLGTDADSLSRFSAITTSAAALIAPVVQMYSSRYSGTLAQKAAASKGLVAALRIEASALEARSTSGGSAEELLHAVEKCNALAKELIVLGAVFSHPSAA